MTEDAELLHRYVAENSESAFAELVQRRIDLVYSVALRQVGGDAHLAQDVTQKVFADLARKAPTLVERPVLTGWLYRSAQYAASDVVRSERRRRAREQETSLMNESTSPADPPTDWGRIRPLLDEAMGELSDPDRDAIALRYFEARSFGEVGRALSLNEDAARKRVDRGVDKLAGILSARGLTSTAATIAAALAQQGAIAAPAGLAANVAATSLAGATAAGVVTSAGVLTMITSVKSTLAIGIVAAVAVSTAVYQQFETQKTKSAFNEAMNQKVALDAKISDLAAKLSAAEKQTREAEDDTARLLTAIAGNKGAAAPALASQPAQSESQTLTQSVVDARYRKGQELARNGNWKAALEEFLWCYDDGMIQIASYAGVRSSFLLGHIAKLAQNYPPAHAVLVDRRDKMEKLVLAQSDARAALEFSSLNRALGESARTLELFDRLPAGDPRKNGLATLDVIDLLIAAQRYSDITAAHPYDRMLSRFESSARMPDVSKLADPQSVLDSNRRHAVTSAAKNLEAIAGAGDLEHAALFARRVLAYDASNETRNLLQKHLARAGHPDLLRDIK